MVFRPQPMELYKLTTPKDDAWKVIEALGHDDNVQFLNMNEGVEVTKLIYQDRIKLCEETERRILALLSACREHRIEIIKPRDIHVFSRNISSIENEKKKSHDLLFDAIETEVKDCERFIIDQKETIDGIKSNMNQLEDYSEVLKFISEMTHNLQGARPAQPSRDAENPGSEPLMDSTLQFIAGTVKYEEMERMKKMLFRITRGKALTHFKSFIQDGAEKVAYLVVFSAAGGNKERVQKVCDSFMGQRFEVPDLSEMQLLQRKIAENDDKIAQSRGLYSTSVKQLQDYLYELNASSTTREDSGVSTLEIYKYFVAKEKAIYHALNMLKLASQTFIGYMWIPSEKVGLVQAKLQNYSTTEMSLFVAPQGKPGPIMPTSFKTNDMLQFHQLTVDTYKYATHNEINPAIFQIVTFPFLFAVMYGDYGHGAIFFLLGIVLCAMNSRWKNDPAMKGILMSRYFWLMMGFFSCYQGLLYNEFFAVTNNWFGTCYDVKSFEETWTPPADWNPATQMDRRLVQPTDQNYDCVYPFGMDPGWALSLSYLTYTNNIKEKLSVIIAYFHLNFGMVLNLLNAVHQKKYAKIIFDIITGFFIFLGLIGFMIVLIYVKWWYPVYSYNYVDSTTVEKDQLSISTSPAIITLLIGDVMGITGLAEPNNENLQWFSSQQQISNILVYIAFICLPIMLCAIPCIHICCGPKHHHEEVHDEFQQVRAHNDEEEKDKLIETGADSLDAGVQDVEKMLQYHSPKDDGDHGIGEIFIHQVIETIEFVLGCISNTASYLRLWALSLAHGQLGEVFLQLAFQQFQGIADLPNASVAVATIYFFILGFGYMAAVFAILLAMDLLEVFLHTMRLHWVEFMGKFFEGAGIPFKPFSFTEVFEREAARKDAV